jgi:hypothetical protein
MFYLYHLLEQHQKRKTSFSQENSCYKLSESFALCDNLACRATQFIRGYGRECGRSQIGGNPFVQSSRPLDSKQKDLEHAEKCYKFGFHASYQNCWPDVMATSSADICWYHSTLLLYL